jgi:hypothetical protein
MIEVSESEMMAFISKTKIRQGASYFPGTTIDGYLQEDEIAVLYEKWEPTWPEPLVFQGGVTAITCEKILEVDAKDIRMVYGKKLANRLLEVAERNGEK